MVHWTELDVQHSQRSEGSEAQGVNTLVSSVVYSVEYFDPNLHLHALLRPMHAQDWKVQMCGAGLSVGLFSK